MGKSCWRARLVISNFFLYKSYYHFLLANFIFQWYRPQTWQFYLFFPALFISGIHKVSGTLKLRMTDNNGSNSRMTMNRLTAWQAKDLTSTFYCRDWHRIFKKRKQSKKITIQWVLHGLCWGMNRKNNNKIAYGQVSFLSFVSRNRSWGQITTKRRLI